MEHDDFLNRHRAPAFVQAYRGQNATGVRSFSTRRFTTRIFVGAGILRDSEEAHLTEKAYTIASQRGPRNAESPEKRPARPAHFRIRLRLRRLRHFPDALRTRCAGSREAEGERASLTHAPDSDRRSY